MRYIIEDNRVYLINKEKNVLAYVTFPKNDEETVMITHTYVNDSLRGKGIASKLLDLAYDKIKQNNLKVIPVCSYAISYFNKNKNKRDVLKG